MVAVATRRAMTNGGDFCCGGMFQAFCLFFFLSKNVDLKLKAEDKR